jgi:hypothetical protein
MENNDDFQKEIYDVLSLPGIFEIRQGLCGTIAWLQCQNSSLRKDHFYRPAPEHTWKGVDPCHGDNDFAVLPLHDLQYYAVR